MTTTQQRTTNRVPGDFDAVADSYDLLTSLNPGYLDALAGAAGEVAAGVRPGGRVLDLGCGTGLSTRALVDALAPGTSITGVDGSTGMLAAARAKAWPAGVEFRQGLAEDLVSEPGAFDGVLCAYLLRNVDAGDRDAVLASLFTALAPGGVLVVHEYSLADARARAVWTAVCWGVVIPLALVVARSTALYRYLWRSVLTMDAPDDLALRLLRAGFVDVRRRSEGGWQRGVLQTFVATKPAPTPASR